MLLHKDQNNPLAEQQHILECNTPREKGNQKRGRYTKLRGNRRSGHSTRSRQLRNIRCLESPRLQCPRTRVRIGVDSQEFLWPRHSSVRRHEVLDNVDTFRPGSQLAARNLSRCFSPKARSSPWRPFLAIGPAAALQDGVRSPSSKPRNCRLVRRHRVSSRRENRQVRPRPTCRQKAASFPSSSLLRY